MLKNVRIYKGPIYKLYCDEISLVKNNLKPNVVDEKVFDDELFYEFNGLLVSLRYDSVLSTRFEALNYLNHMIDKNKERITDSIITKKSVQENKDFHKFLKSISSYLYCVPSEIKDSFTLPKKELKELIKENRNKK